MKRLPAFVAACAAIGLAFSSSTAAHADNIDFGTNQDACQSAAHEANASGNASAFCFQTGPGHYSLSYTPRQAPNYSPRPVFAPPAAVRVLDNDYVALAVSTMNANQSWYATAPSQDVADQLSMAACINGGNIGCAVAVRAYRECASVGIAESGQFVGGWGPTPDAAANGAMNAGTGVRIVGGQCANSPSH